MTSHEKYLRHSLRTFCDSDVSTDLHFISSGGGQTFCHKFILLSLLPELRELLCSSCCHHQVSTISIPEVSKADLDMARDYLYMFGDVEPFRKIFEILQNQVHNEEIMQNLEWMEDIEQEVVNCVEITELKETEQKIEEHR